jgi:hypothetical protein
MRLLVRELRRIRERLPAPVAMALQGGHGEPAPSRDAASRHVYDEFTAGRGVEATRYGDWEYGGRCTDF